MFRWIKHVFLLSALFQVSLCSANFVLFTEPKTGTHLLIPILSSLTGKNVYWAKEYANTRLLQENEVLSLEDPASIYFSISRAPWKRQTMDEVWKINEKQGSFLHLHAPYSKLMETYLADRKCISFFIKRDPRDQIVSLLNHYKYINLNDSSLELISSDDERLLLMINNNLRSYTLHFMGWLHSPACCVLDFDKLMGAHGGVASDQDAMDEMRKIASALGLHVSDSYLHGVYKSSFGKGWGFFKGKVGAWKEYFNEEHKAAVKQTIGDLLIELGYEKDTNW